MTDEERAELIKKDNETNIFSMKHVKTDREKRIEALEKKQLIKAGVIKEEKNKSRVSEYLGNSIEFKMIDGNVYANATSMCKVFGKKFAHWMENKTTKEMITEVSEAIGIPTGDLVIVENGIGSMIHEELVLELSNWLNVKFRRWCQKQITTLIREGTVSINTPKTYIEALEALILVEKEKERLLIETTIQKELITKQKNTIHDLTSVVDSVVLRKTFTDYVGKVVLEKNIDYATAYSRIYSLVGRMLKKDLNHSYKQYKLSQRELVDKNRVYNKENSLKGVNRVEPFTYKDSNYNISMVEYIVDILKEAQVLIEAISSVCDVGVDEILDTYQIFRDDDLKVLEQ